MKYQQGLVSIIMPLYNTAKLVVESIQSIENQTYPDWKLIIVDDCSTDNSYEVVEKHIAQSDKGHQIKLIKNTINLGSPMTRNEALREARGQFIAFCDADDLWLPDKLTLQVTHMSKEKIGLTYTQFRRVSEKNDEVGHLISPPTSISFRQLLGNTAICTSTAMVNRAVVGDVFMYNHQSHDFILWAEILRQTCREAQCIEEDLVRYRVVSGSYSRKKLPMILGMWSVYRTFYHFGYMMSLKYLISYGLRALSKYKNF